MCVCMYICVYVYMHYLVEVHSPDTLSHHHTRSRTPRPRVGVLHSEEGYPMCFYVCVRMCVYVCVCMYVCVCTYVCVRIYVCVCEEGVSVFMYMYVYVCVCVYVCMYVCMCVCGCICVYMHVCICMYVRAQLPTNTRPPEASAHRPEISTGGVPPSVLLCVMC
jgi:hypothetical protein